MAWTATDDAGGKNNMHRGSNKRGAVIGVFGYLARGPKLNRTRQARLVVTFPLASERSYMDHSGARRKTRLWFSVKGFGVVAEMAAKYLTKGSRIYAEGRLASRNWIDRRGKTRPFRELVASDFRFLDFGPEATPHAVLNSPVEINEHRLDGGHAAVPRDVAA
jgi:single-strand DNA-binding protein